MTSGPKTVITQCSLKDKRRRLVRQHATEEDDDVAVAVVGLLEGGSNNETKAQEKTVDDKEHLNPEETRDTTKKEVKKILKLYLYLA